MSVCKKCGEKRKLISDRSDGLCPVCGADADLIAQQEAAEIESQRLLEVEKKAKEDLSYLLNYMTTEDVIAYSFVASEMQEKTTSSPGFWIGGALGGMMGAVIGNILAPGGYKCSGKLGLMVLTQSHVYFFNRNVPLTSTVANTNQDHLAYFRELANKNSIYAIEFDVTETHLIAVDSTKAWWKLKDHVESYLFTKSALYINGIHQPTDSIDKIREKLSQSGNLICADNIIERLLTHENFLTDQQYAEIRSEQDLSIQLFHEIYSHPQRDDLKNSFPLMCPLLKNDLYEVLSSYVKHGKAYKMISFFFLLVAIVGLIIILSPSLYDIVGTGVIVLILGLILSLVYRSKARKVKWCNEILDSKK